MCRLFFYMEGKEGPTAARVHTVKLFMEQTNRCNADCGYRKRTHGQKNQNDGYGFVWLKEDGLNDGFNEGEWNHYRSAKTYMEDPKYPRLAKQIQKSPFIMGHLRNSSRGNDITAENNQPFMNNKKHIFAHHGTIADFDTRVKKILMREITLENIASMGGTTDSETLFYWIESVRDSMPHKSNLVSVFKEVVRRLNAHQIEYLVNLIYVDAELGQTAVLRATVNHRNRTISLWRNRGIGEWIISTEPVSETQQIEIPDQTVSILNMKTGTWRTYNL